MRQCLLILAAGAAPALAPPALAQPCTPAWQPGFGPPGLTNFAGCSCVDAFARTAIVHDDDGPGPIPPALFVAGQFAYAGGIATRGIARWDGAGGGWSFPAAASWPTGSVSIFKLIQFNDGLNPWPTLYAIGNFPAGANPISGVRRLNGTAAAGTWELPGGGGTGVSANAAAVHTDASGTRLYIGSSAGALVAPGCLPDEVLTWNGAAWSNVPLFPDANGVRVLESLDLDGPGPNPPALVAGGVGIFQMGAAAWTSVGPMGVSGFVTSMAMFDEDGAGANPPRLFVCGPFSNIGGTPANDIAKLVGAAWQPLGTGLGDFNGSVPETMLQVFDDGPWGGSGGAALYVGGPFFSAGGSTGVSRFGLAKWTGSAWQDPAFGPFAGQSADSVLAMLPFTDSQGPGLALAGRFMTVAGRNASKIALQRPGLGVDALTNGLFSPVLRFARFDDGLTPPSPDQGGTLYASIGGPGVDRGIVRLTSSGWQTVATLISTTLANTLHVIDLGNGPRLFAGTNAAQPPFGLPTTLSYFDGTTWTAAGMQLSGAGYVGALTTYTPVGGGGGGGGSPHLVVGGQFTSAGAQTLNNIALYNGSAFLPLGSGINIGTGVVRAVAQVDDITGLPGRSLIAAGQFSFAATGGTAVNVARWDGSTWRQLGAGLPVGTGTGVYALKVFDDGTGGGPRLYAAGAFDVPGSTSKNIARWNGTAWEWTGTFPGVIVESLEVHDPDGPGGPLPRQLLAGGSFSSVGGQPIRALAAWNPASGTWSAAAPALTALNAALPTLKTLVSEPATATYPSRLLVGGAFVAAGGVPSSNIGILTGCPRCPADFDASGTVDPADVARFVQVWFASISAGTLDGDFDGNGVVQPADVSLFVTRWFGALTAGC